MSKVEVVLPQMGEGIIEATITRWLVEVNEDVTEDSPILEIATDKVDSEIPSPVSGKLVKQLFSEGEIPKVGDVVAIIEDGVEEDKSEVATNNTVKQDSVRTEKSVEKKPSKSEVQKEYEGTLPSVQNASFQEVQNISLFIRNFARLRGITSDELVQIKGSGAKGQLLKEDIYNYIKSGREFKVNDPLSFDPPEEKVIEEYEPKEGEEVVELDRTRLLIADHMVRSVNTAPHVTSFVEADITPLVEWRDSIKEAFKEKNGFSFTYTPIITEVVVKALKEFPGINISLLPGNKLLIKNYYNIGIATALPDGNLIVPVINKVDELNLAKIAYEIADKTTRAKQGLLKPAETKGGTFTITNLGMVGNLSGTPIINQPESAILAVGAIKKKPGVVLNKGDYAIGIRDIVTLSLSYDHRIIDGGLGGTFLTRIGQLLESYKPELIL